MSNLLEGELFTCGKCGKEVDMFYQYNDAYYGYWVCEDCFNETFGEELKDQNTEWFTSNYDLEVLKGYNQSFKSRLNIKELLWT